MTELETVTLKVAQVYKVRKLLMEIRDELPPTRENALQRHDLKLEAELYERLLLGAGELSRKIESLTNRKQTVIATNEAWEKEEA